MNQEQLRNMVYAGKVTKEFIQNFSETDLMEACEQFHVPTFSHFTKFVSEISFKHNLYGNVPAETFVAFGLEICEAIKNGQLLSTDRLSIRSTDFYQSNPEQIPFDREQLEINLWAKIQASYGKHKTKLHNKTIKKFAKMEAEKEKFTVIEGKKYKLVEVSD